MPKSRSSPHTYSPALQPRIRVAHLDAAIAFSKLSILHALQRLLRLKHVLPSRRAVLKLQLVRSERHFWKREAQGCLQRVALGGIGDGARGGRDRPVKYLDGARVRRLQKVMDGDHDGGCHYSFSVGGHAPDEVLCGRRGERWLIRSSRRSGMISSISSSERCDYKRRSRPRSRTHKR